jgi:hypothetical protein
MEPLEIIVAIALSAGSVYKAYDKYKNRKEYKNEKYSIYNALEEGIEKMDAKLVNECYKKLEEFDEKYFESKCKVFFGRKRLPKVDKVEKKFKISKELLKDEKKLSEHFRLQKTSEARENKLKVIVEEEEKVNEAVKDLKFHLQKLIRRNIAKQNNKGEFKGILVNLLNEYHKELEGVLEDKLYKNLDIQKSILEGQRNDNLKVLDMLKNKQVKLLKK